MDWKTRLREAFGEASPDDDVLEELAQHAAATYAAARAEGGDEADAMSRVARQIAAWTATPALLRRRPRRTAAVAAPAGGARVIASITQDARYAWRLLRRQPGYAALVITTLALGIAATTVIGSVAYGVLLKPLPWADAPRLVRLVETRQGSTRRFRPVMTNVAYNQWRDVATTLDALGGWSADTVTMTGAGAAPERITIARVTPSLLPMLRGIPSIGRAFTPGEEQPGRAPLVIVSHGFWQQRLGGRADAIGQPLRLDATVYTVIGVMPASFVFPDRETRAWMPFYVPPLMAPGSTNRSVSMFQAIGRLRDGATPQQAGAEGTARGRTAPDHSVVAMAIFGTTGALEVTAVPLLESMTAEVRPAILILLAAAILLLATSTANVASLQLARATTRRRELAIRAALGAARGRLLRQAVVENLLLGLLGGTAGLALAAVMHRGLPALLPVDFPRIADLAFDFRIQACALLLSMAAGLGCGLLPALHAVRRELVPALVEDSLAPVGGGLRSGTARARALIMSAQIAIAGVLLVGALLLIRSFTAMMNADLGYDFTNVLTARLNLPDGEFESERRLQTLGRIVDRMSALPGVTTAAFATVLPFYAGETVSSFPIRKPDGRLLQVQTGVRFVSPGYFTGLGQRLAEGRDFTRQDTRGSAPVVIVNREFARKYLEGRATGAELPGVSGAPARRIVGVVEDAARRSVTDTPQPETYFAAAQHPMEYPDLNLIVRMNADPIAIVPSLRAIVHDTAPTAPLESIMTMEDRLGASLARPRLYAVLLGTFSAFALAIAGVGLFGVLSYTVAQRAREIGVRTALGAQVRDIVGLIVGQSLTIAGAGIAAGLLAAYWLTRSLQTFLYGVTPHDARSFAGVGAVLLLVSLVASVVPARRAARVDPVKVLRA
ncbi:MAG: ABC transporter permease [Vicinamibacterales bacterium]